MCMHNGFLLAVPEQPMYECMNMMKICYVHEDMPATSL